MAKHKLNAAKLATIDEVGRYHDGEGLYLQVTKSRSRTNRSWVFKYTVPGSGGLIREMGLGSLRVVSLKQARVKADAARNLVKVHKLDPIDTDKAARIAERLQKANAATFKEEAEFLIAQKREGWKSGVHAKQWASTLSTYAYPVIGGLPVSEVNTDLVLKVLQPIWKTKTETATRLRARIENVLSSAKVRGKRAGDNPAAWKGHLDKILAAPKSIKRIRHHPALPYEQMPEFFKELRERDGISARALEFLILNASRTSEVIHATWAEIDFDEKQWTIPKERMKIAKDKLAQRRDHVVPLSDAAVAALKRLQTEQNNPFVFIGGKEGQPLSNMALLELMKEMRPGYVPHGFRSTFKDWCSEETSYPNTVSEMALAHVIENKTESAYRRGNLLQKRRRLMADWAAYCERLLVQRAGNVTPLRKTKAS